MIFINIKLLKYYFFIVLFLSLIGCSSQAEKENKLLLKQAAQTIDSEPKASLDLLNSVETALLNEEDYAYFTLLQVRAWEITGKNMASSDVAVIKAKDYFISKNNAPKVSLACFVLAKVYVSQGKTIEALYNYQLADEWAKKTDYTIPDFLYSAIPYNIGLLLSKEKYYIESLVYLGNALKYIDIEKNKYSNKLLALEIKAINFDYLENTDSSLFYYDKVLKIAEINNDYSSKNRIIYNECALLYHNKDYIKSEKKCKELLNSNTDSIIRGCVYMTLAAICKKTQRLDSAHTNIYKAEKLLINAEPYIKLSLYDRISSIEKTKGNYESATQYAQKHDSLNSEIENFKNTQQQSIQNDLKNQKDTFVSESLSQLHSNWLLGQNYRNKTKLYYTIIALLFIAFGLTLYKTLKRKRNERELIYMLKFGKETLLRNILQRKDLIRIIEYVDDNFEKTIK